MEDPFFKVVLQNKVYVSRASHHLTTVPFGPESHLPCRPFIEREEAGCTSHFHVAKLFIPLLRLQAPMSSGVTLLQPSLVFLCPYYQSIFLLS